MPQLTIYGSGGGSVVHEPALDHTAKQAQPRVCRTCGTAWPCAPFATYKPPRRRKAGQ